MNNLFIFKSEFDETQFIFYVNILMVKKYKGTSITTT